MDFREALEAIEGELVLIEDGGNYWTVADLIEALEEYEPTYLSQEVYIVDDESIIAVPGRYLEPVRCTIVDVGKTPHFVERIADKEYRVRLRISDNETRHAPRPRTYRSKQGAYQRKDALNKEWREKRVLVVPLGRPRKIVKHTIYEE